MNRRLRELDYASGLVVGMDAKVAAREIDRIARRMPDGVMDAAIRSARRAVAELRREVVAELTRDTCLDDPVIKKAVRSSIPRPRGGALQGSVRVATRRLPLIRYARGIEPLRVTAEPGKRSRDWTALRYRLDRFGKTYDNSPPDSDGSRLFVARMRSGHLGVFSRAGRSIEERTGPSVQFYVADPSTRERYEALLDDRFCEMFERSMSGLLGRLG